MRRVVHPLPARHVVVPAAASARWKKTTLTDRPPQTEPPRYWSHNANTPRWQRQDVPPVHRFLGGSPVAVLIKLIVVSLIVGALLMWLDIRPAAVFRMLQDLADRLWTLGFASIREFGNYIIAGAAIVVPVWLVLRLLSYRGR